VLGCDVVATDDVYGVVLDQDEVDAVVSDLEDVVEEGADHPLEDVSLVVARICEDELEDATTLVLVKILVKTLVTVVRELVDLVRLAVSDDDDGEADAVVVFV
jgi:hypothetical protein